MQTTQATASDQAPAPPSTLVMPERPAPPRMPPVDLRVRVKTSPALRRLIPTRFAVKRAEGRGAAIWEHDAPAREDAIAATQTVIAGTPRAGEIDEIARAHLIEDEAQRAMFWQPWITPIRDPLSTERLLEALTDKRGLLLSPCHTGPYAGSPELVMEALGHELILTGGPWFFDEPTPDLWGRRLARWRKGSKAPIINTKGSFQFLLDMLKQGVCVHLFFDMPGPHATSFLGKPAMLADGIARLATQADAPILPLRSIRAGHRKRVEVAVPLDPREFTGVDDLHAALAAQHERWILERPAEMTDPRSFGWAATPTSWDRPPRADEQGRPARS
jgi:Bacterial lipid A biosynthesis acyltransferase